MWSRGVMCVTSMLCTGSQFSMFEKNTQTSGLGSRVDLKSHAAARTAEKMEENRRRIKKWRGNPFIDGDEWMMHHISLI